MSSARALQTASSSAPLGAKADPFPLFVALAGNPNCGKTTLFNALTGSKYKVANYPGVTVEKKEGRLSLEGFDEVHIVDLPGIYTLSGFSVDERIATQLLNGTLLAKGGKESGRRPDLIVAVVDSANLERNLFLVSQLIDRGFPLILALNMMDLAEKRGITIYKELLSRALDVPVVSIVASAKQGLTGLKHEIAKSLESLEPSRKALAWLSPISSYRTAAAALGLEALRNTDHVSEEEAIVAGMELLSETTTSSTREVQQHLLQTREDLKANGIDSYSYEAAQRYLWINSIVRSCSVRKVLERRNIGERFDQIVTHPVLGVAIFLVIMAALFQSIFLWSSIPMDLIESAFGFLGETARGIIPAGVVQSLVVDGIIAGVGSVAVFVPQIAILFFFLGLLEDSGYLSRAAFMMDRVMRPVGLQGRSFIPLLSSFACAIPGILSARTIPSWADRMATILIAPLMSCSARLPVYTVLIGAFIPASMTFGGLSLQGIVLFGMYLLGVLGAALISWILKHSLLRGQPALFVMEMPPFRLPSLRVVLREVFDRAVGFLKSVTTVILACSIVLWFLASYPKQEDGSVVVRDTYAGRVGVMMEPVIKPLGFNWEIGVGILASFAAREVFVSSLATIYNLQSESDSSDSLMDHLRVKESEGTFSLPTALSLMVFYVFACQCMSTLAVARRETGSWKWPAFMLIYMTVLAYGASWITFRLASAWL